jgi:hypothetical protein
MKVNLTASIIVAVCGLMYESEIEKLYWRMRVEEVKHKKFKIAIKCALLQIIFISKSERTAAAPKQLTNKRQSNSLFLL